MFEMNFSIQTRFWMQDIFLYGLCSNSHYSMAAYISDTYIFVVIDNGQYTNNEKRGDLEFSEINELAKSSVTHFPSSMPHTPQPMLDLLDWCLEVLLLLVLR